MTYNIATKEETIQHLRFAIEHTTNNKLKKDYQRMIDSLNTRIVEGFD